jgi:hypothetical protein
MITLPLPSRVTDAICHCLRCAHWSMKHSEQAPVRRPGLQRRYWDVPAAY